MDGLLSRKLKMRFCCTRALLFTLEILLVSPAALGLPQLSSPLGPVVNLGYAAFAGNSTSPTGLTNGPVTFFGGIPYAQPPLGNLRFRAPAPISETVTNEGNATVIDARNWGPPCIQQPAQVGIGSEGWNKTMFAFQVIQDMAFASSRVTEKDTRIIFWFKFVGIMQI